MTTLSREGSDERPSPLEKLVEDAQYSLSRENYDKALADYHAAAKRFRDYKTLVNRSVDEGIRSLSTIGCAATPPHPKALELIRLRDQFLTK
jgi:hypothetical protein